MASERELSGIYAEKYLEFLLVQNENIKSGGIVGPELSSGISRVRTKLTKEEIAMVEKEADARIALMN
ncbi:MAG: hypothetical protein LBE35_04095 [Clostridiales bacterium]|jgi:hypothetical protein|nr:hypothetical protein [Clostridiales bacterium]